MLTSESRYDYDESLKTVTTAFTPRQSVFFMPMAWTRAENIQYQPEQLVTAFSESTPLSFLVALLKKVTKMKNAISVFNFNQNQIRTISVAGQPYFCLSDACAALNVKQCRIDRLSEHGLTKNQLIDNLGRQQEAYFINEPNLYRLIFRSNKPQAQAFADWVYNEVLPAIRKTGAYSISKPVIVSEHTRRLPSAPREIVLSEKAKTEIGGIVKTCTTAVLKEVFAGLSKAEPLKLCTPNNKMDEKLLKLSESIVEYGRSQYRDGMMNGMIEGFLEGAKKN